MSDDRPPAAPDLRRAGEAIRKRSVKIAGHSTSLSLEGVFWDALKEVAIARGLSLNVLIEEIDRGRGSNLSSAVRVYLLNHYRHQAKAIRADRNQTEPRRDSV
ncbi:MAG TPA: ribbon-helix-helix domain-containing protein [Kiloniellaceae bacterium]